MSEPQRIAVIGAGAWGTALAQILAVRGHRVGLWARRDDVVTAINRSHENAPCLPGIALDPLLVASGDLETIVAGAEIVVLAVPAQHVHALAQRLPRVTAPLVLAAKGFERRTHRLIGDVLAECVPHAPIAILTGPSFASDVASGLPTAVTLAAREMEQANALAQALATPHFRVYASDDVVGAQVGGAVKNVIAIACGIVIGRGLGESARAALMTRGLAEMARLSVALGGRRETMMGLSGLGDLALTCGSPQSRNFALGLALGRGAALATLLAGRRSVVEGIDTAAAVDTLARTRGLDMPVVAAVTDVLHRAAPIDAVIRNLLSRPLREEG